MKEIREDIGQAKHYYSGVRRVFLADGNALVLPTERLLEIISYLREAFPSLQRVGIYARATDILGKSVDELKALKAAGLGIFYVGLESGSDKVLKRMNKGYTSGEAIAGCLRAQEAGVKLSTIILLGIGGCDDSLGHALESARMVSAIDPRYLSMLTLMILKNTPLHRWRSEGSFTLPDPRGMLEEMRAFIEHCDLSGTIFRTNHASNYIPLEGILSRDKAKLTGLIDEALGGGLFRPEFLRGL
jgi:radical SAM superfamily enzyme YgiQ (UPF0313 family)